MAVVLDGGATDVRVTFRCGHTLALGSAIDLSSVACDVCGDRRVRQTVAPPPRIRATDCDARSPLLVKES